MDVHRVDGKTERTVTVTTDMTEADFASLVNTLAVVTHAIAPDAYIETFDVSLSWLNAWVDAQTEWDPPDEDE